MKKIFLLLAVVALASCVKENGLEPQVNAEGQVTINAVAADSKTLLDGLNVVWEQEDALAVVLAGDVKTVAEFAAESVDGANAKFVYAGDEALAFDGVTSAYAVYPTSAVSQEGGVVKVSHTLPEVQTGVVKSGMNLSSAALSVEELVAGQATAQFKNALALLQVVVPAGVKEVTLHTATGAALVGDMTFNVVDGVLSVASNGTKRTVTLSTGSELAEGTHNLLVYPGYASTLTLTMTATDDAVYTSEVSAIRFTASESRTINLTQIFKMGTEETMYASPAGGEVVVPVVTAADYIYEVAIEGNPEWLTYALPTKAFHGENIVFTASKNETGAERSANVTISWGENQTRTFTIAQKAIYMDFVNDADGNPIQWEETFGVYGSESDALAGTNAKATYKNVFTIELSDNFNKGTYKIVNAFYENNQMNGRSGATYYADYEGNVLSIYKGDSGYVFDDKVITLTYNENSKEFVSAGPIKFNYTYGNVDFQNGGYIGGYKAVVKVEEPENPSGSTVNIAGTWNQTLEGLSWPSPSATMTIDVNGSTVTITDFVATGTVVTTTFENNQIVVPAGTMIGSGSNMAGPLDADVVLTLEGNTFTAAPFSIGGTNITSYSATNPDMEVGGGESEEPSGSTVNIAGTWNQTLEGLSWPSPSATMTIDVNGSTVTITDFVATGTVVTTTFENNQIVVPAGTMIGSGSNMAGPLDADVVLTLEGNTFTAAPFSIGGTNITSYSATR